IGVFRADKTLKYVAHFPVPQAHAAWCAVNPKTRELYSAPEYENASRLYVYQVDWDALVRGTPPRGLILNPVHPAISVAGSLQGGEISPDGRLLYLVNWNPSHIH